MTALVALDVDGVLFPAPARLGDPLPRPDGYVDALIAGLPVCYHPDLPAFLRQVSCRAELAWATSWGPENCRALEQHFGLERSSDLGVRPQRGVPVLTAAAGRALVWCEDRRPPATVTRQLRERAETTLIVRPRVDVGLTAQQMRRVLRAL